MDTVPATIVRGAGRPKEYLTPDGKSYVYEYGRTLSDLYLVEGIQSLQ